MELEDSATRVSIGFPLGLTLLVALLLFFICFFVCCLHWDKFQSLLQSSGVINAHQRQADLTSPPQKPVLPLVMTKQNQVQSLLVLMPGDKVPKFIAMACPYQPPRDETITVQVQQGCSQ